MALKELLLLALSALTSAAIRDEVDICRSFARPPTGRFCRLLMELLESPLTCRSRLVVGGGADITSREEAAESASRLRRLRCRARSVSCAATGSTAGDLYVLGADHKSNEDRLRSGLLGLALLPLVLVGALADKRDEGVNESIEARLRDVTSCARLGA